VPNQFAWNAGFLGALLAFSAGGGATAATVMAFDEADNGATAQPRTMILDTIGCECPSRRQTSSFAAI
jgi:hypothetical protein